MYDILYHRFPFISRVIFPKMITINPLLDAIIGLIILLFSAIVHEIAHGYVADRLGDPTARLSGRLTLDPRKHIDPLMSIILPLLLLISGSPVIFGAAKPVPIDPFNLKEGRKDIALVSLSGPLTNLTIGVITAFIIRLIIFIAAPNFFAYIFIYTLEKIVQLNLILAIFNSIPIPPLDGSKVFSLLLPEREANIYLSIGSIGIFILFFLLLFPFAGFSLSEIIYKIFFSLYHILLP